MPNKITIMSDTVQEANHLAALALVKAGFFVFPAGPNKRPLVKDWQTKATSAKAQIDRWWSKWPDAMPALPTGKRNGLAVLDVDLKDGKDGGAALRDLGHDPDTLSTIRAQTPSNGQHVYFRWPEGMGNSASGLPDGVDVRGEGGFVIAPGAINDKGAYALTSGSLSDDLTDWPEALLPRPKVVDHGDVQPTGLPFETIRDALMALPNDGDEFSQRDDWLRIGMALHAETGGGDEGRDAWHDWSGQWPGYDDTATDAAWDSFKSEGGVTGFTIMAEAEQRGWHDLSAFDNLAAEDKLAELDAILLGEPQPKAKGKSKLTFLSPSDCERLPARRYVVKGLLAEGDVAAIVGAPGAGKSLLAPYLGYAVARGADAFGRRTRQGGVLYVAAEDSHGMRARLKALKDQYGDADNFTLVEGASDLLNVTSGQLKALGTAVKERRPALIVVDTIAAGFSGLEENDAKSMGVVVGAARSLTRWGAAVVLVHHDTKAGDGLPRGHSILNGALDMSLHLKRDGTVVRGKPTKNRNGSTDQELAFSVGVVRQGVDEDGDPISAAICDEEDVSELPASSKRLPASAKAALDILGDLLVGRESIIKSDWRAACLDSDAVSAAEKPDDRGKAFRRALEELARRNLYLSNGDEIRLAVSPDNRAEGFTDDDV
ncbi:AAA family ATPase [Phaeobacter porticola]|uniref:Regulatory protein RepA n=1 Tax=Phaeobacter porticola TaxID=1844006 RepID=A0A1L3I8N4_9RHOB|nr:AAA family ATPase [Phaeobacter porticola]APG48467.1 Regulatory protein RepA [Phaeobacter porticola]